MTHSLAAMAETLRGDPGSYGVVSGVGMHMQKHAYGVWSTDAGAAASPTPRPPLAAADPVSDRRPRPRATPPSPPTRCCTDVTAQPERALLVCDLPGGGRCYAFLDGGEAVLSGAEADELIGRHVTLTPVDGVNHAHLG